MTNPNYTHITVVADRSGSMYGIRTEAEGAINSFIDDQRAAAGTATLTLVDFDSHEPQRVVFSGRIEDAPAYELSPRGNTPLRDAIGRAIVSTGQMLAELPEDERPGHVFFVVQTDGQENSSTEWTQDAINAEIARHETEYGWTFVFLATGPQAWNAAQAYVGTQMLDANTVKTTSHGHSHDAGVAFASHNIAATRGGAGAQSYGVDIDDDGILTPR